MHDFDDVPRERAFGGETYDPDRDHDRLAGQLKRVLTLMSDGNWRMLLLISDEVGGSEAAVSARLRDLRKKKYGGREVLREYVANGVWRYRLVAEMKAA